MSTARSVVVAAVVPIPPGVFVSLIAISSARAVAASIVAVVIAFSLVVVHAVVAPVLQVTPRAAAIVGPPGPKVLILLTPPIRMVPLAIMMRLSLPLVVVVAAWRRPRVVSPIRGQVSSQAPNDVREH